MRGEGSGDCERSPDLCSSEPRDSLSLCAALLSVVSGLALVVPPPPLSPPGVVRLVCMRAAIACSPMYTNPAPPCAGCCPCHPCSLQQACYMSFDSLPFWEGGGRRENYCERVRYGTSRAYAERAASGARLSVYQRGARAIGGQLRQPAELIAMHCARSSAPRVITRARRTCERRRHSAKRSAETGR